MKILLIEDDNSLGKQLKAYLEEEGYSVALAKTAAEGTSSLDASVKLIILDWSLPDKQGIDLLKEIKKQHEQLPVIMLTARTELVDKVVGLEAGANDYITKPFEPKELIARIRVQLRQKVANKGDEQRLKFGDLEMDLSKREVLFKSKKIELTKMEYELLKFLVINPNKVFSREELLDNVWGYNSAPTTRTVDTHILQLRNKISEELFESFRGVGYRFKYIPK